LAIAVGTPAIAVGGVTWARHSTGPEPAATRVVRAGVATLAAPGEWRTVALRDAGWTVVLAPTPGARDRVIVTVGPAEDPSLVPPALRGLVRDLGRGPRETSVAGHRAWLYAGVPARNRDEAVDVSVLPSAAGVLGIACISPASSGSPDCASSISSVSMRGAALLAPSQELALRLRLGAVLTTLDRARIRDRARLQSAGTFGAQAAPARGLARQHLAAADALRPVAGAAGAPLVDRLVGAARAYFALARAASAGSTTRFDTARLEVETAEAQLIPVVDGLVRSTARVTAAPPATRSPSRPRATTGRDSHVWPALLIVAGLGLLGFGLGVLRIRAPHAGTPAHRDRPGPTDPAENRGPAAEPEPEPAPALAAQPDATPAPPPEPEARRDPPPEPEADPAPPQPPETAGSRRWDAAPSSPLGSSSTGAPEDAPGSLAAAESRR
jgi:hypothetical protein